MADDPATTAQTSASPYSTGGGGVRLEHRLGAVYLARLLTNGAVSLLGDRPPTRVAFQQSPATSVDDLVIDSDDSSGEPSRQVQIAVRRTPKFVKSDVNTQKLVLALVQADLAAERAADPLVEVGLAIAVSGQQVHVREVADLAVVARNQPGATEFFALIDEPKKFATKRRLSHLRDMVAVALSDIGDAEAGTAEHRTWSLLRRLSTIELDLEPGREAGWTALVDTLVPIARDRSTDEAVAIRDRLEQLAGEFAQTAASVDAVMLRRRLHGAIDLDGLVRAPGWARLLELDSEARSIVSRGLVGSGSEPQLILPRAEVRTELASIIEAPGDLLVKGESGVGKSALVLDAMEPGAIDEDSEAIVLNLRHLPETQLELLSDLISPFDVLLAEMSAPTRMLVIDGAEAAAERHGQVFAYLLRVARSAGVKVIAIAANDGAGSATEIMRSGGATLLDYVVPPLTDDEIALSAEHFPELGPLALDVRGRELLRRPIVVDLLGRAGNPGVPLSESDALDHIWKDLVRNGDRSGDGHPDKREDVMLRLAAHSLQGARVDDLLSELDASAVEGLRRSGLLLPASGLPWERVPAFKHDLLRSYSVARYLLSDRSPATRLLEVGAPRWALPASRLACEIVLSAPDEARHPLAGRFQRLQQAFEAITADGHGERWTDVPSEALLAVAHPTPIIEDAWPTLTQGKAPGLQRIIRVLHGRHQSEGFLDPVVAEPVVRQLLRSDRLPARLSDEIAELIRDWLRSHVLRGTVAGQATRLALAGTIVARCVENERVLDEEDAAKAAALAARAPEEVAADEARRKQIPSFPSFPSRRRRRPEPTRRRRYLWISDDEIEQLALLGPDLGSDGEAILRRIAEDEPHALDHVVEPLLAGHSLASYDPKLLIDLVSAYYIDDDDEEDDGFGFGSGLHDDGIRHHRFSGGFGSPLSAYYHGPFLALFRADIRGGLEVLNRMLNHAARHRVRIVSNLGYGPPTDEEAEGTRHTLGITGEASSYIGDGQVWLWYRGTGVGPYPCMSALQALEFVMEEFLRAGVRAEEVVPILLGGAESLAMPALALGILVRHLDTAGNAIDPFLVEPLVWDLEFSRAIGDQTRGFAAQIPNLKNAERRAWTLREVCTMLNLGAEGERLEQLRQLGDQLVSNAEQEIGEDSSRAARERVAAVRGWAASLDRASFEFTQQDGQVLIQQAVDPEIEAVLGETNQDLLRGNDAAGLSLRHAYVRDNGGRAPDIEDADLAADIATARDLIDNPPNSGFGPEGPVAAAASAVELHFTGRAQVAPDDLDWSAQVLLQVAAGIAENPQDAFEDSFFSHGMDRSAARALPLLLLPAASELLQRVGDDPSNDIQELIALSAAAATKSANEARLAYARGLDLVWETPCSDHLDGRCHHAVAFDYVNESFVDSIVGPWDQGSQRRAIARLDPPSVGSLQPVPGEDIIFRRLGAGLRAAGAAAISSACVRDEARDVLEILTAAHQRAMLASEHGYHHSQSESLIAARAVLWQAIDGRDGNLLSYVDGYLGNSRMLAEALQAIAAAGDERAEAAEQAGRLWPKIMDRVLSAAATYPKIFTEHTWGDYAEAALIPNPTYTHSYLTIEMPAEPYPWRDLLAWGDQIERWLAAAACGRMSIDHLLVAIGELVPADQVLTGMKWVEEIVRKAGDDAANTFTLPEWLHERRADLTCDEDIACWQRIVDLLVVAGDHRVADLAD
ncbi:hypothetical protein ACE2AJ_14470 [Aquihabitans daechungensis]|uniref:hypothetical protein n=1 Tax=Aquihabitans daechungensis TaxID=1052257 RepID=UPI003BA00959